MQPTLTKGSDCTDGFPCGAALQAVRSPRSSQTLNQPSFLTDNFDGKSLELGDIANSDNNGSLLPAQTQRGLDLARRSQQRVTDIKRSEKERRAEEDKQRRSRQEQERHKRDQAAQQKHRRRAEIYALNAILRDLQQRKIAEYIAAQQQLQADAEAGVTSSPAASSVAAIGV